MCPLWSRCVGDSHCRTLSRYIVYTKRRAQRSNLCVCVNVLTSVGCCCLGLAACYSACEFDRSSPQQQYEKPNDYRCIDSVSPIHVACYDCATHCCRVVANWYWASTGNDRFAMLWPFSWIGHRQRGQRVMNRATMTTNTRRQRRIVILQFLVVVL